MMNCRITRDGGTYMILSYIRCFYYSAKYEPKSDKVFLVGFLSNPGEMFKASVAENAITNGYQLVDVYNDSCYTVYKFKKIV